MSDFVVHTIPGSPFARSVVAALQEKGAPWRLAPLKPGTLKEAEHLARHPFGRMPVFDHGEFRLYETQAILRYIDRVLPGPSLTPSDPKGAARMDQLLGIVDWYLFQGVGNVIGFHRVIGPKLMGLTADEAAVAACMPKAQIVFDELERLLGDKPFLAGDALTLADLHVGPHLSILAEAPEWATLTAKNPQLAAWLARIEARPSFLASRMETLAALAAAGA